MKRLSMMKEEVGSAKSSNAYKRLHVQEQIHLLHVRIGMKIKSHITSEIVGQTLLRARQHLKL